MALATIMSRLLGLVREQLMAWQFGASGLTDAFLIAYRIPNLFRDLLAEGAFSAAFVPKFVEAFSKGGNRAQKLLYSCGLLLFLLTFILSLGMIVFSEELIFLFSDDKFHVNLEQFNLAVMMLKIMSFYLLFVCLAALLMGALNSLKMFFIPALAPVVFNLSMIGSLIYLPNLLNGLGKPAIYALSIGVLIGGIGQFLIQLPFIFKKNLKPTLRFQPFHSSTRGVFVALGPGLIGFAATQLNLLIATILATSTIAGAVSWLSYAFRLFQLPMGVIGVSLGSSHLVHFSEALKNEDQKLAITILKNSSFYAFSFILPFCVTYLAIGEEIVRLIFERGQFDSVSTQNTFLALRLYALSLPFYCLVKVYTPSFYSLNKPKKAVFSSVISILLNISFSLFFLESYGFLALALGLSLGVFLNSAIQVSLLAKELETSVLSLFSPSWIKSFFAALCCYGLGYFLGNIQVFYAQEGIVLGLFKIGLKSFSILASYIFILYLLGEKAFIQAISKRLSRK